MAVHHQVIPPATGHAEPAPGAHRGRPALRVPLTAELWPDRPPVRAGVSSMGFGGINAHVASAGDDACAATSLDAATSRLVASRQDAELLLLDAGSPAELRDRVAGLAELCRPAWPSPNSATWPRRWPGRSWRPPGAGRGGRQVAPDQAARAAPRRLLDAARRRGRPAGRPAGGVFLGTAGRATVRIGFRASPARRGPARRGGALRRRFAGVGEPRTLARASRTSTRSPPTGAQPRIVTSSVAGLRVLARLGIEAAGAAGHSLGELTACTGPARWTRPACSALAAGAAGSWLDASAGRRRDGGHRRRRRPSSRCSRRGTRW